MRLFRALWGAIFFLALPSLALAQGSVLQVGPVTGQHAAKWAGNGQINDAGSYQATAIGSGLSDLSIVNTTVPNPSCIYDASPATAPAWHSLCLGAGLNGGSEIAFNAFGSALAEPFTFNINGVVYPFPGIGDTSATHLSTEALLAAYATPATTVIRDGYYAPGDGGVAVYTLHSGACSLNAGAGDGGSQVPFVGGSRCWIMDPAAVPPNVLQWGAKCDSTTDDGPAFNAATAAVSTLDVPGGRTCRVTTPVVLTKYPITITGHQSWPSPSGAPSTIQCNTNTTDCFSTPLTTTQKGSLQIKDLVFDGSLMTGGNTLHMSAITTSYFTNLTMNSVYNGIEVDGPDDNTNTISGLLMQGVRGSQGLLWHNASGVTPSFVLTVQDSTINCTSSANGIVMDGNLQTLRTKHFAIIDCAKQFWMTGGGSVCPGYAFFDDIEFNGGSHTVNFIRADCGYSVQMINGWSFGAASGDGYVFNQSSNVGSSNIALISNSELLGQPAGRGLFVNWNNFTMSGTFLTGSVGNVLEVGPNALGTNITGGEIGGSGVSTGYCIASQLSTPSRSLYITGTTVTSGCAAGSFNDPGKSMILDIPVGYPPLPATSGITGCGSGCTVAIFNGNQAKGSLLLTPGSGATAAGQFVMNFTVPFTPYPLCFVLPRSGSSTWNARATVMADPAAPTAVQTTIMWDNNSVALTPATGYFLDFQCTGL